MINAANEMSKKEAEAYEENRKLIDKPFYECNDQEKIQKLRMELINQRYLIDRIVRLERTVDNLKKHEHLNGELFIPFITGESGHIGTATTLDLLK